jgi:isorenieratene synthase
LDVPGLRRLVEASPGLRARAPVLTRQVEALRTSNPYAVSRLWLGGDVADARCAFTSVAREATLDSVTLYHRIEGESRRWAAARGGSVVELHAYAAPDGVPAEALHRRLREEFAGLWAEVPALPVLAEDFRVGADAPAFEVGSAADRPGVRTDAPGIRLAGDGLALPFPTALMERAVASGLLAANDVLAAVGAAAEPVWSIRPRGLLAGSRAARAASARAAA